MNTRHNKNESPAILVTTHLEEPNLLQILVEKLAECNCGFGFASTKMADWQTVESSSLEAFVSGGIIVSDENALSNIPFVNTFLFTCIKPKRGYYNLTWSTSLS